MKKLACCALCFFLACLGMQTTSSAKHAVKSGKPNILIIWGDEFGKPVRE